MDIFKCPLQHFVGDLARLLYGAVHKKTWRLTVCWCSYQGSSFCSVILRAWVLVRTEPNSRPPAWQPNAQPTEPPVCEMVNCGCIRVQNNEAYSCWIVGPPCTGEEVLKMTAAKMLLMMTLLKTKASEWYSIRTSKLFFFYHLLVSF